MKLNESKITKTTVKLNSKNILIANSTFIDEMIYLGYVINNEKERFIFKCIQCGSIKIVSRHTILQRDHLYKPFAHSFIGNQNNPREKCKINKPNQLSSLSKEFLIYDEEDTVEKRTLKISFNRAGGSDRKNSYSPKLSIPMKFLKAMGVSKDEREVIAYFDGKKIIIQKK